MVAIKSLNLLHVAACNMRCLCPDTAVDLTEGLEGVIASTATFVARFIEAFPAPPVHQMQLRPNLSVSLHPASKDQ